MKNIVFLKLIAVLLILSGFGLIWFGLSL